MTPTQALIEELKNLIVPECDCEHCTPIHAMILRSEAHEAKLRELLGREMPPTQPMFMGGAMYRVYIRENIDSWLSPIREEFK